MLICNYISAFLLSHLSYKPGRGIRIYVLLLPFLLVIVNTEMHLCNNKMHLFGLTFHNTCYFLLVAFFMLFEIPSF